eukprot:jgi/Botrbrau1/3804/Bobra.0183s0036.1
MVEVPKPAVAVRTRTKKGKRILERREPKLEEDVKKVLLLYGNKTSQTTKDVLTEIQKLKQRECVRFTRKNDDVRPFEAGGETRLEFFAQRADCGLFAMASHSKKRPHNLTLGRFLDGRVYDLLELGVASFLEMDRFGNAASAVQAGNKPCFLFAGDVFERDPEFVLAKSLLLDLFRGRLVRSINLKGIDHVILVAASGRTLYLRQYAVRLLRSGTMVPNVKLTEMGPVLEVVMRRHRAPAPELEKVALKQRLPTKKKVKNVGGDSLDGKVGRIYMPKQDLSTIALHKMKGVKRARQQAKEAGTGSGPAGEPRAPVAKKPRASQ